MAEKNEWKEYGKAAGGAVLILAVLVSTLYSTDYRSILEQYPDQDLILLDFDEDKIEFLARSFVPDVEYVRWSFVDEHTNMYFGRNKVGDSFYTLKCYYDLNGKRGYRNIVQKNVYPVEYKTKEICVTKQGKEVSIDGDYNLLDHEVCDPQEAVVVTQKVDYYRDSRHKTKIGTMVKETQLYPLTGKESVSYVPDDKDMPCQIIWRVDDLDEYDSITFKSASQSKNEATFAHEYNNKLKLDWSDAANQVSWARQYSTSRLYVAYESTRGDQLIDPVLSVREGISLKDTTLMLGPKQVNINEENLCCKEDQGKIICVDRNDGDCKNYPVAGQSVMVCTENSCTLEDQFYSKHSNLVKGVAVNEI